MATYTAGTARAKNSAGAVMRSLCDLCAAVLAFWAVGGGVLLQSFAWIDGPLFFADGRAAGPVFFFAIVASVSSLAADGPRSVVLEQVQAGVAVRMAVLYRLLAGASEEEVAV